VARSRNDRITLAESTPSAKNADKIFINFDSFVQQFWPIIDYVRIGNLNLGRLGDYAHFSVKNWVLDSTACLALKAISKIVIVSGSDQ
jgi:hypothetical protein